MKVEYIFIVNAQGKYAVEKDFEQFICTEMSNLCSRSTVVGERLSRCPQLCDNFYCANESCSWSHCNIEIKTYKSENDSYIVYSVTFFSLIEKHCELFSQEQKLFHNFICKWISQFEDVKIVWDDVSLFNAKATYPEIYEIENLMRNLITKFMVVNIGKDWEKYIPPTLRTKATKRKCNDNDDLTKFASVLYNLDFIDLSSFLFDKYQRQTDTSILRSYLDDSNLSKKVLNYIDMSNWERYFGKVLKIDEHIFVKKWKDLYGFRCKIAHNNFFTKDDIQETQKLANEIKRMLLDALEILTKNSGNLLSSEDKIAFIKYGLTPIVTSNLTHIVDVLAKICVLKNWDKHDSDTMNFLPSNQLYQLDLAYLKFYLGKFESLMSKNLIGKNIHDEMQIVYFHCKNFFSDTVDEKNKRKDESSFVNLPDEMNDLAEDLEYFYLREKRHGEKDS